MKFKCGSYGYIATSDLEEARLSNSRPKPCVYYSQQACEKILKHYLQLSFRNEDIGDFLRSHKVKKLAVKSGIPELLEYRAALSDMQDYYFDGRYPSDDYIEPTEEDAVRILDVAETVFAIVMKRIEKLQEQQSADVQMHFQTQLFKE